MTCRRIGQSGFSRWIRLKKCGVIASASFIAGKQNAGAFFLAQGQMLLQLRQGGDTVFQLPLPIVPKLRRNLLAPRPIARRVGAERFFLLNVLGEIHHFRNLWAKNLTSLTIVSMRSVLPYSLSEWIRLTPPHQGYSNAGPSLLSENPHTRSTKDTKESDQSGGFPPAGLKPMHCSECRSAFPLPEHSRSSDLDSNRSSQRWVNERNRAVLHRRRRVRA